MPAHILCVGDIHLGRRPLLPLSNAELNLSQPGPIAAWHRTVDEALSRPADAVLLAGDVVDGGNRFFEAVSPLRQGLEKLSEAGIPIFAVSGNHDADVLHRLAQVLPSLRLLGADGSWELAPIGNTGVRVLGRGFTDATARQNPMDRLREQGILGMVGSSEKVIGLLHCDLCATTSPYAPVRSADFGDPAVSAWLLGHIHTPSLEAGSARPVGYLGSLCGLDPTETGPRGPWWLTVTEAGLRIEQVPLSPLRWEMRSVDAAKIVDPDELAALIDNDLLLLDASFNDSSHVPDLVGVRLRLVGRSACCREIQDRIGPLFSETYVSKLGGRTYFVDKVDASSLRPEYDLAALANDNDAPGILAGLLLSIERGDDQGRRIIEEAILSMQTAGAGSPWTLVDGPQPDAEQAKEYLLDEGYRSLEVLMSQKPAQSAPAYTESLVPTDFAVVNTTGQAVGGESGYGA